MPRLLVCKAHGVMYNMRDYDGPAEYDMELIEVINRHKGQTPDPDNCRGLIFRTDEETASKLDTETEVRKELAKNHIWVKDFRDELKTEAIKCFNRHDRPKNGCIDWCDESKTVGRKVGVPKDKRQYLCMYCPAADHYVHKARTIKGYYDQ
jgi:hypothetical protein